MKMFSSFSHYKVVPNLYTCMSSAEDSCWSPLTSIADQKSYRSQWGLAAKIWLPVTTILQNTFCVQQKKEIHTGLEQLCE